MWKAALRRHQRSQRLEPLQADASATLGLETGLDSILLFPYGLTYCAFSDKIPFEVIKHRL